MLRLTTKAAFLYPQYNATLFLMNDFKTPEEPPAITNNMPHWLDSTDEDALRLVASQWIPHDYQISALQLILSQQDLLFSSGTGCGKAGLFTVPLVVHQELAAQPELYPTFPVKNPIALVVTLTKGA
ncbi:hypothetical protein D9758_016004 [Tetrapyrgos nigripes]|uniref:DEAD/DEAH box helicase domain-containing protein n=1 Tax=Tetrapyrgos nigripes TaxID=182062 RepID=A0A8H5CJW3_9AGAR|nr:hypothetical protein D9758_016004 [Tetrapyrgos nigripes]